MKKLIFVVTDECNFSCRYCLQEKSYNRTSKKTIEKVLSLFIASSGKYKKLKLFGGEPLICFHLVKYIIVRGILLAEERGKKILFEITTNGSLLNEEVLS